MCIYSFFFPVAGKKRTPPDFTWMNSYQPKESSDQSAQLQHGVEGISSSVLNSNDDAGESEVDAAHHRLGGQQQKVDSTLSSPDVAVHRSSIATGEILRRWRDD